MQSLELAINLCDSTIQQVQQDARTVTVDLDDTPEGAIRLIFEAATISYQTIDFARFEQIPSWHLVRRITWANVIAQHFCFAMESGDGFWLQAQALRLEQRR